MAVGQIDPARLEGDALTRWYLRSPTEIEEERHQTSNHEYNTFFSRPFERSSFQEHSHDQKGRLNEYLPVSRMRPVEGDWLAAQVDAKSGSPPRQFRPVPTAPRRFWDYWGFQGCQNCHGYKPGTLPPILSPRSGDGSGGYGNSARRGEWSDRPQCNLQFESDRKICQAAKSPRCWENQTKRLGHCSATGEVGTPPLTFGPPGR